MRPGRGATLRRVAAGAALACGLALVACAGLTAPVAAWKKVILKQLDPIQGMMTSKLKLSGNMAVIMKNVKAAKELVESSTHIDTEFPI